MAPPKANENVIDLVKAVGYALDYPITESMIDACHRLGSPASNQYDKPLGIIVKMVRRMDAQELLVKRRVKRNLSTSDIGLQLTQSRPIYLNESLSPARRKLFNAVQEKKYTYLWIRGGKMGSVTQHNRL